MSILRCHLLLTVLVLIQCVSAQGLDLDRLTGKWRTQGSNIVEITVQTNATSQGVFVQVAEQYAKRGVKVGSIAFKDIRVDGDKFSFQMLAPASEGPIKLEFCDATGTLDNRGNITGTRRQGSYIINGTESERYVPDDPRRDVSFTLYNLGCTPTQEAIVLGAGGPQEIRIELGWAIQPLTSLEEEDGAPRDPAFPREEFCHYKAIGAASARLQLSGKGFEPLGVQPFQLTQLDIEFYRKLSPAPGESPYKNVRLSWNASGRDPVRLFSASDGRISFELYEVEAMLNPSAGGSGVDISDASASVKLVTNGDVQAPGLPLWLTVSGLTLIKYTWAADGAVAHSWTDGQWEVDFAGNVGIELRKDDEVLASAVLTVGDEKGTIQVTLESNAGLPIEAGGMLATVGAGARVEARWNIAPAEGEPAFEILYGKLPITISAKAPLSGDFRAELEWKNRTLRGAIQAESELGAFGLTCKKVNLACTWDFNSMQLVELSGGSPSSPALELQHEKLDGAIQINSFLIRDGRLINFDGSFNGRYSSFGIDFRGLGYEAVIDPQTGEAHSRLKLRTASMRLDLAGGSAGSVKIEDALIEEGQFSLGRIQGAFHKDRVFDLAFDARFINESNRIGFKGALNAQVFGSIAISGEAEIGEISSTGAEPWQYGNFWLQVEASRGIPIPYTGLSINGGLLGFGFNYEPTHSELQPDGTLVRKEGDAKLGAYTLLAGVTMRDAASISTMRANVRLNFGNTDTVIGLVGQLQVTPDTPYLAGELTADLNFSKRALYGTIGTGVKLPSDGKVVAIERGQNQMSYSIAGNRWRVQARELSGNVVILAYRGKVDAGGEFGRSFNLDGRLAGTVSAAKRCDWSVSKWGSSLTLSFAVQFNGDMDAQIRDLDLDVKSGLRAALNGSGEAVLWGESLGRVEVSATAAFDARVIKSGNSVSLRVEGPLRLQTPLGEIGTTLTYTFGV